MGKFFLRNLDQHSLLQHGCNQHVGWVSMDLRRVQENIGFRALNALSFPLILFQRLLSHSWVVRHALPVARGMVRLVHSGKAHLPYK